MNSAARNVSLGGGGLITGRFGAMAAIAQFWTPYDLRILHIADKLRAPNAQHWFGTDQLGRDVLSMIMAGAQTSVGVALLSVIIGVCIGVPLGLLGAARRGATAEVVAAGHVFVFA